ncbi:hypothetical protein Barb6XT_01303 [Bacteroidales bacterium Barb6XT]|nr:hypothetical protein Barb6XT_01303 [Bacteroidales bacterium Barb6XT]
MYHFLLALFLLGCFAAAASRLRNRNLRQQPERGEIPSPSETQTISEACCGQHEVCERDTLRIAATKKTVYYEDEDLDRFRGTDPSAYDEPAIDEFREVLYTLRETEVSGWLHSLQLRAVSLPDALRDEAFLMISDRKIG